MFQGEKKLNVCDQLTILFYKLCVYIFALPVLICFSASSWTWPGGAAGVDGSLNPGGGATSFLNPGGGATSFLNPGGGATSFLNPGGGATSPLNPGGGAPCALSPGGGGGMSVLARNGFLKQGSSLFFCASASWGSIFRFFVSLSVRRFSRRFSKSLTFFFSIFSSFRLTSTCSDSLSLKK